MAKIKAGVVVVTQFCKSNSKAFSSYVDYIDRKNAVRNDNISKYNLYQDYMGNPDKSTGLFTETSDLLNAEDKKQLKEAFKQSQLKDSLMWQTVISFDNKWLEKNGLYSCKENILDEERIKGITRSAVHKMLEKEGLQNAIWSAAIHFNTDNIHIHIATVEPEPMREKKIYVQYRTKEVNGKKIKEPILDSNGQPLMKEEYKGRFKQSSIETCKREMVNQIINERENNLKINNIIRDSILQQKKEHPLVKDKDLCQMFFSLYKNMPDCNRNMWNYNNPIMHSLKPEIDKISNRYLSQYHKREVQDLTERLIIQEQKYTTAYGESGRSYSKTKLNELYTRMGNAILKEIRSFDKDYRSGDVSENYEKWLTQAENNLENDLGVINDPQENIEEFLEAEKDPFEYFNEKETIHNPNIDYNDIEEYLSWEEDKYTFESVPEKGFRLEWSKEYKQAKKYIHNKRPDYKKAIMLLKKEDIEGNVLASYELGDMYRFGREVEIDLETANNYYAKTLRGFLQIKNEVKGYRNGKFLQEYLPYRIGKMHYYGLGTEQNYDLAMEMFQESGSIFSKYMLGKMAYSGQGMEQDYELAYEYFSECANDNAYAAYQAASMIDSGKVSGSEKKMQEYYDNAFHGFLKLESEDPSDNLEYRIGCMYLDGKGVEKDEESAEEYLRMAADAGNMYAKNKLAMLYLKRDDISKIPDIIDTLKAVVEKTENIWSMYALGNIYLSEKYNHQDVEQAIEWYKRAEQDGNEFISYKLGKIFLNEQSDYYNVSYAIEHMEKAYKEGNMMAAYQLGKIYSDEHLECYNLEKAIRFYKISAENDNALSAYQLGKIFLNENNGKKNIREAVHYLKMAAEKDSQYATYQLGKIYYDEQYGMKNDLEAYRWFEKSAKEGNLRATYQMAKIDYSRRDYIDAVKSFQKVNDVYSHFYLGKIYLDNSPQNPLYNPKKGLQYMKQASQEGNTYATTTVGLTYLKGNGVRRDAGVAKYWLNQAKEQGNSYAAELLKNMNSGYSKMSRIKIGVSMTTAISKMKRGLKSEWEKTRLEHEHERLVENSLE